MAAILYTTFSSPFSAQKYRILRQISLKFVLIDQLKYSIIASNIGLVPNRRQATSESTRV